MTNIPRGEERRCRRSWGGGKTVRQKSSFGLVGVLNRSLVDRQIGKMQKSKQPKAKPVSRRGQGQGERGEGFSFELTSSAAAAGKFVMRNIHLAQLFGLVLALLHVVVVVHCAIFICSQKFLGLHRRRRPFRHLHFGSNGNFEFEFRFFLRFSVLRLTVGALQSDR